MMDLPRISSCLTLARRASLGLFNSIQYVSIYLIQTAVPGTCLFVVIDDIRRRFVRNGCVLRRSPCVRQEWNSLQLAC